MTGCQKIQAALSPRGSRSTPIVICYPELFLRDCWERITRVPWWGMHSPDIEMGLQVQRDLLAVTGEDRFRLWMSPTRAERERYRIEGVDATRARRIDTQTGEVEELLRPPMGGFVAPHYRGITQDRPFTSREEIDATFPLPPEETRESLEADGRLDKPRRMMEEFGRERMPWTQLPSPWDPLYYSWGFEGLMIASVDRPDLVEYACRRVVQCNRRRLSAWKAAGVELIWIQDCQSDHISPEQYRRLVLPSLQEMTADLRAAGMASIHYYTGNPNDRLEILLAGGADALSLEATRKHFTIDIEDIARRVGGRAALLGNLDELALLERGPTEAIRAEVKRQLDAGRINDGRFLMGIAGPITPGTPLEHVRALADAVHELAP